MNKHFFKYSFFLVILCSSFNVNALVSYDLVTIGDPFNSSDQTTGFGSVDHIYKIGKYTVTIEQYTEFLNAVAQTDKYFLYNSAMSEAKNTAGIARAGVSGFYTYTVMTNSGYSGNRPITSVSWFSAARFANWMANGQPAGPQDETTTEEGAYTLNDAISGDTIPKNAINPNTGSAPTFYLPSDDEWYKAAYYNGAGSYYLFATQSNSIPGNAIGSLANQVNYISNQTGYCTTQSFITSININYLTDVGTFTNSSSHYGTYDQSGNVWEWNAPDISLPYANLRGGAYTSTVPPYLLSTYYLSTLPGETAINLGFRLAAPG